MKATKSRKEETAAALAIDFPEVGETVRLGHYAVRLSVPEGMGAVEVSIDHGPWLACRPANGHWWFDWTGYDAGMHHLQARLHGPDGRLAAVKSRRVTVAPEPEP